MKLIILGAPGAGKGTQAVKLAEKLGTPHISTGDIFRYNIKNKTELGLKAKVYMDEGKLVPDDLTMKIVEERLSQADCCENGFIFDGFPRTISQAEKFDEMLRKAESMLDSVLNLSIPDEELVERISGRRVCPKCNASYHVKYIPPNQEGTCDHCLIELIHRNDDQEETVRRRLEIYHKQTKPLIEYYKNRGKFVEVRGKVDVQDTTKEVFSVLGVIK